VAQFKTSELSIFSYYVESEKDCLLIDPVLDVENYRKFISQRGANLKYVLLSHYHADYLSGHTAFNVPIVMGPKASKSVNQFKVHEHKDEETIGLGSIKLRVLHTPGHTPESSCYLLSDSKGKETAIFSGGTVFLGEVGRPDLASSENITSADLAGLLYNSIQRLKRLDGDIRLYPGHGSGSACGKSIGTGNYCTMGVQNTKNYGFKFTNKEDFVKELTENIPKAPKYFFYDADLNQKGTVSYEENLKEAHVPLSLDEFDKLRTQMTVIDTRHVLGEKGTICLTQGSSRASSGCPTPGPS
jgi:hydroxyacylglutathione hydrolase